uniref:TIR domain-containing protein n=1 Tax=Kalanchoe fedtschenkoi TaxID=63787 RepID=A0A7N0T9T7_KALFE
MATGRYTGESSNPPKTFQHQVFLSFRGTDTRIFVGHLFSALKKSGVRVFLDNDGLEHGRDIQLTLYNAIHHSEMSVVILSLGYADSRWCLDELAEIMELHKSKAHSVLPVFFDVEPTVVRNQTGAYMDAFQKLEKRFGGEMDRVNKWRWALNQVAALRGLSLDADRNEALLVENIIQKVGNLARETPLYVHPNIVGRDRILRRINMWVQDGSSDVEVGLIYGLAGIGKTTIAQLVFNQNVQKFDGASFLADFTRKTTQGDGLTCFLEQIISNVTGKSGNKIYNVEQGLMALRSSVHSKKVLVVLDDVDELKQLPAAFDDPHFFGKGSKIIITTKNQELRKVSILKQTFEVGELGYKESMELLKLHSLVNRNPSSQSQEVLLEGFLRHCHGLPLAQILMGHMLRDETQETWEDLLKEMDRYPNKDVQNVFRMSYEAVGDNDAKELFLYVACFFIGVHKKHAAIILESCGLRAVSGLQKLINRCLLLVDYDNRLSMHKSIEKMGKEIVDQEAVDKRSILWNSKDSLSLLLNDKGTLSIRGLRLNLSDVNRHTSPACSKPSAKRSGLSSITTSAFKNMPNLEILLLSDVQLVEKSFEDFPESIKWIQWEGFPLESISLNLNLDEVVVLDMQKSCLVHAWEGIKELRALRVLFLNQSDYLVTTPDLSCAPLLELISFEGCISLVEVHESVGNLERLEQLNMKGCISLVKIHGSFKKVNKLTILNLNGCKRLTNLSITMLSSVEKLDITECQSLLALNQMESSGISMSSLSTSSPYERSMTHYQVPYWQYKVFLPALKTLNMSNLGISRVDIFDLIKCAPSLEELDLSDNPIRVLSSVDKDACLRTKSDDATSRDIY